MWTKYYDKIYLFIPTAIFHCINNVIQLLDIQFKYTKLDCDL